MVVICICLLKSAFKCGITCRTFVPWVCGVGVSRSLRMGEARGSNPRSSNIFCLINPSYY